MHQGGFKMAIPVLMPKQGQSVESCLIIKWNKKVGDKVKAEEPICEVETDCPSP
jgi:pyruvate dehydrogenase E2 component (dihydrolipoamide acetyltransferase)